MLGSPVAHSLSPLLHRTAYDLLGLRNWTYDAIDVSEDALPAFVEQMDDSWAGLSLTMPLKAAILPLLGSRSEVVEVVGAANTAVRRDGALHGENTDVAGLVAACTDAGVPVGRPAAVLGGGATARSAIAALGQLCSRVTVFARASGRTAELLSTGAAVGVAVEVRAWDEARGALAMPLVVNTTPAGAADGLSACVPADAGILFDVVYAPWPTALAAGWAARAGRVVGGLELLVHQAVLQVELMTRVAVDAPALVAELRAAGAAALEG